jgi:hypothetical protein
VTKGGHTDRAGQAPGDLGADRQAKGAGRACAKRYPRSGPCDQDQTEGIRGRPRALRTGRSVLRFSSSVLVEIRFFKN